MPTLRTITEESVLLGIERITHHDMHYISYKTTVHHAEDLKLTVITDVECFRYPMTEYQTNLTIVRGEHTFCKRVKHGKDDAKKVHFQVVGEMLSMDNADIDAAFAEQTLSQ